MTQGRPHYYTKRDANQKAMSEALEALGFEVYDVSPLPDRDCPGDILTYGYHVGIGCKMYQLFEVKAGRGRLTAAQRELAESGAVPVAREVMDILGWYCRGEEASDGEDDALDERD